MKNRVSEMRNNIFVGFGPLTAASVVIMLVFSVLAMMGADGAEYAVLGVQNRPQYTRYLGTFFTCCILCAVCMRLGPPVGEVKAIMKLV